MLDLDYTKLSKNPARDIALLRVVSRERVGFKVVQSNILHRTFLNC